MATPGTSLPSAFRADGGGNNRESGLIAFEQLTM